MYILFLILWIILNGRVTVETVLFGLVIAGAVYWFICRFMDYSPRKDLAAFRKLLRGFQYVFVLLWEIMRANIKVMQLDPNGEGRSRSRTDLFPDRFEE